MAVVMQEQVAGIPATRVAARTGEGGVGERPFFAAAIGVILTVGALWGVIILLRIALQGSFTSVGVHEVNAHGHAQIFGWVGLFVMGFGYRVLPGLVGAGLAWPRAAAASWAALLAGLVLRSGLQPFVVAHPELLPWAHVGSVLEVGAIGLFSLQMGWLLRGGGVAGLLPGGVWLVRAAVMFFALQAVASAVYFHLTATAPSREELLWLISHFQPPLRDLQVHGFAMLMVLGVGMLLLPRWMGTRAMSPRASRVVAVVMMVAVVAEIAGFLLMRVVGHRWAAVWGVAALMMLGGATGLVAGQGLLGRMAVASRSGKFLRAAHGWLLLSLSMLVLLPVWQFVVLPALAPASHAVEIGFSHAYYGSIRHAITVGFVSMMILGMSVRLMERQHAGGGLAPGGLVGAFCLVNIGCATRVLFQMLTDLHPMAFPVAGVSGLLELTGIGMWAVWMVRGFVRGAAPIGARELATGPASLGASHG